MPRERSNKYVLGAMPGTDPQTGRVIQDLVDQLNYLNDEVGRLRTLVVDSVKVKAKKESPVAGIITLPGVGGDGFIRVNEDGVIVSYSSATSSAGSGISQTLHVNTTEVTNPTAAASAMHTFTIPAGSFANTNDYMIAQFGGFLAANANNKQVLTLVNNAVIDEWAGISDFDGSSDNNWYITLILIRISSTTLRLLTTDRYGFLRITTSGIQNVFAAGFLDFGRYRTITVSDLNTNGLNITIQGQSTVAGEVTQGLSIYQLTKS